jgi:hypothetical protein
LGYIHLHEKHLHFLVVAHLFDLAVQDVALFLFNLLVAASFRLFFCHFFFFLLAVLLQLKPVDPGGSLGRLLALEGGIVDSQSLALAFDLKV